MPMNKLFTLNYLISSYRAGKGEVEFLQHPAIDFEECNWDLNRMVFEPSQSSMDAILNFASQYEVLHSHQVGTIELNLN